MQVQTIRNKGSEYVISFDMAKGLDKCFVNGEEVPMPAEIREAFDEALERLAKERLEAMIRGTGTQEPFGILNRG